MSKPLNILYPTGSFYPAQTGGPDNTMYWITKALTRRGHRPVISTTDRGQPATTPVGEWLETDYGQAIYTRNAVHYLPVQVVRRALGRLREVDALHLAMITYPASFLMAILNSWSYGKPMLWSTRGDLDPPMLARSPLKKRFVLWLIKRLVRRDKLWFHSTCAAETAYIRDNFGADARIIEIVNYMELPAPAEVATERYLLFIGRIDPKKGIDKLLTALQHSESFRHSDFTLRVVGDHDNPYGRSLVEQVERAGLEDKVAFLGHRGGKEKQELLAGAWFTLMPSITENHGIVVMESLAQGTPAVASTGTPWQILDRLDAGYWVANDPKTLRSTVEEIIELPEERMRELRRNALHVAQTEYNIFEKVSEWETAYRTILS